MKLGVIIIVHNNAENLHKDRIISILNEINKIKFCFVNNASKDESLELLMDIKDESSNVSILDIKKYSTEMTALKAGCRFLKSMSDLNVVGFLNAEKIKNEQFELNDLLSGIHRNEEYFQDLELLMKSNKVKKSNRKLSFSVIEYLNYLNSNLGLVS